MTIYKGNKSQWLNKNIMLKFFLLFGNSRRQTAIQTQGSGSSHIHLHFNVKKFLFY